MVKYSLLPIVDISLTQKLEEKVNEISQPVYTIETYKHILDENPVVAKFIKNYSDNTTYPTQCFAYLITCYDLLRNSGELPTVTEDTETKVYNEFVFVEDGSALEGTLDHMSDVNYVVHNMLYLASKHSNDTKGEIFGGGTILYQLLLSQAEIDALNDPEFLLSNLDYSLEDSLFDE